MKPYLFDFICSVKPRFAGAKLVEFMASEFPSMPREYYRAAAEAGRLRQERGAGRRRRGSEKEKPGGKKKESSKGETQQETKRVKSVPEEEEEKKSVVVGAEEEEEERRQQQQQQDSVDVELVDNATIRHLLPRHEPPALDLGPVRVLGYSAEAGLWAVGKPPGMPVHAAGGYRKNTVCGVLEAAARAAGRGPPSDSASNSPPPSPPSSSSSSPASLAPSVVPWPVYLHPLHRLDKPVSGVLLFAESSAAAERARAQLAADRRGGGGGSGSGVRKVYVARVRGVFPSRLSELATEQMRRCAVAIADAEEGEEEGEEGEEGKEEEEEEEEGEERKGFTLDVALGWDSAAHRAKCFPEGPKYLSSSDSAAAEEDPSPADAASSPPLSGRAGAPRTAATSFSLLSTAADGLTSLVECRPLSGRTHQIRAHLGFLGHPIANDALYYETTEASAAASALYPGPERPRLEAHGGGRGAGEGGAGCCCPAAAAGGGREGEEENGDSSSSSSSSKNACISAADVAEILDQCGWVVGGGEEEAGGGAAAAKKAEVDGGDEEEGEKTLRPLSPLEAGALSACPFCPSLARPAAASELRPLWLHARSYRGAGWAFECPAPRWASEGFVPRRRSL